MLNKTTKKKVKIKPAVENIQFTKVKTSGKFSEVKKKFDILYILSNLEL